MSKYGSRKFLLAVGMAILAVVNAFLEANGFHAIPQDTVEQIFQLVFIYLGVEGARDAINAYSVGKVAPKGGDH